MTKNELIIENGKLKYEITALNNGNERLILLLKCYEDIEEGKKEIGEVVYYKAIAGMAFDLLIQKNEAEEKISMN